MTSSNLATQNSSKVNTRFSLVNSLLEYPDRAAAILQKNEDIIDYALVQLLENISEYMKTQNRIKAAYFLKEVTDYVQRHLRLPQ